MKRLVKKSDRLQVQQGNIDWKLAKGWTREDYRDLIIMIWDNPDKTQFCLTIYKGTAAHPIANFYYRTEEQRAKSIENYKAGCDRRIAYKAEAKNNPTTSTAANCAAAVKEELKTAFPHVKFSVTSDTFSGGNAVRIGWNDGPTLRQVEDLTGKYQYGHFDGMQDLYEYSNTRADIPQAKYVNPERRMSAETRQILEASAEALYTADPERFEHYTSSGCHSSANFAYRVFQHCEIPAGAKVLGITHTQETSGACLPEIFFCIDLELPAQPTTTKDAPKFEAQEVKPGTVQIIDYSEKAIAVIGDTKPIKEKLKSLGGKFNFRLSCGAGWIFPKSRLEQIQKALSKKTETPAAVDTYTLRDEAGETLATGPESEIVETLNTIYHYDQQDNEAEEFTSLEECMESIKKDGFRIDRNSKTLEEAKERLSEELKKTAEFLGLPYPELEPAHPLNLCDPEGGQYKEALREYTAKTTPEPETIEPEPTPDEAESIAQECNPETCPKAKFDGEDFICLECPKAQEEERPAVMVAAKRSSNIIFGRVAPVQFVEPKVVPQVAADWSQHGNKNFKSGRSNTSLAAPQMFLF
jgi:hypothetical protein